LENKHIVIIMKEKYVKQIPEARLSKGPVRKDRVSFQLQTNPKKEGILKVKFSQDLIDAAKEISKKFYFIPYEAVMKNILASDIYAALYILYSDAEDLREKIPSPVIIAAGRKLLGSDEMLMGDWINQITPQRVMAADVGLENECAHYINDFEKIRENYGEGIASIGLNESSLGKMKLNVDLVINSGHSSLAAIFAAKSENPLKVAQEVDMIKTGHQIPDHEVDEVLKIVLSE